MSDRYYSFKCISYLTEEKIKSKLNSDKVSQWAYILHDKDTKENGELKEKHYHILVIFKGNKSIKSCRSFFEEGEDENTLVKVIEDLRHDYRYLTHKDDKDKVQYNDEEVRRKNDKYWLRVERDEEHERKGNEEFIEDLIADEFSYKEMAKRYGRDFMKNRKAYMQYRILIRAEERSEFLTFYDEMEIEARADEENRRIITKNQYKQYYGEQISTDIK